MAVDMYSGCGNSYAISTIELSKVNDFAKHEISGITDIYPYLICLLWLFQILIMPEMHQKYGLETIILQLMKEA